MGVLAEIDRWPVGMAAAAVVGRDGIVERHGPTEAVVRIASVTKLLVATAVLIAAEEGSLDLDDPAGPSGSTVRHLLAHASGLPFEGRDPVAAPGARRVYSNSGFDILGELMVDRTGMSMAEYLDESVLRPLGMRSTELRGSPAKDCWSSVDDLVRFVAELLAPHLVAAETFATATTVAFPGLDGMLPGVGPMKPNDWGLGFELRDNKAPHWTGARCSPSTFGHFGGTGTFLWVDPAVHVGVVCLTDREFDQWALNAWPALSDHVIEFTDRRSPR